MIQCVFVLLLFHIHNSNGIKCFTCESLTNYRCSHPIRLTENDQEYITTNCTSCRWIYSDDHAHAIVRDCLQTRKSTGCSEGTFGAVEGTECICNSDLCNSTPRIFCVYTIAAISVALSRICGAWWQ